MSIKDITQEYMDLLEIEAVNLAIRYREFLYSQIVSLTQEAKHVSHVSDNVTNSAGYLRALVDIESPEVDLDAAREEFARAIVRLTERVIQGHRVSENFSNTAQEVRDKARKVR